MSEKNIKAILDENSRLKKELKTIKELTNKQGEEIKKQSDELKKKYDEIKLQSEEITKLIEKPKSSYADQLKSNNGPVVVIKPKNLNQNSEKTKKELKDKINPVDNHITNIRKAAKGAIIVECRDNRATEQLKTSAVQKLSENYEIDLPKKRKPKFKICGMSDKLTDEEILDFLIKQNEFLKSSDEFKVVKTLKKRLI